MNPIKVEIDGTKGIEKGTWIDTDHGTSKTDDDEYALVVLENGSVKYFALENIRIDMKAFGAGT